MPYKDRNVRNTKKREEYAKNKEKIRAEFNSNPEKLEKKRKSDREYYRKNSDKLKAYQKEYNENNPEKVKARRKLYYEENKEEIKAREDKEKKKADCKKWRENNQEHILEYRERTKDSHQASRDKWRAENPEREKARGKEYNEKNRDKIRKHERDRCKTDIGFKITKNLRRRINNSIKKGKKAGRTLELTGCTLEFLRAHLESQFKDGMSWGNYGGKEGWQIDHIVPCALFDLTKDWQQKSCFNWQNLQPLWAKDNNKKRDALEVCPV